MHKLLTSLAITVAALVVAAPAQAREPAHFHTSSVSLGVGFGDPTALDLKLWTGLGNGFDFGVGLHRFSERLGVYGEYELGLVDFWLGSAVKGVFYIGLGGALAFRHNNDDTSLALIVPIGINLRFRAPVEIFLEARPGFALLDNGGFGIGGQLGVRYVF